MAEKNGKHIDEGDVQDKSETVTGNTEAKQSPEDRGFKSRVRTPKALDLRMLDLRVGRVKDVEEVEDMDGVFTITIDIKKPEDRIASCHLSCAGFDVYDLIDAKVVTLLNAPIINLDDIECNIRVLAAVKMGGEEGKEVKAIEVLRPPKKAKRGYRVFAEGYVQEQYYSIKEKVYNIIKKDLVVDSDGRAVYRWEPLKVEGCSGLVKAKNLIECPITHL